MFPSTSSELRMWPQPQPGSVGTRGIPVWLWFQAGANTAGLAWNRFSWHLTFDWLEFESFINRSNQPCMYKQAVLVRLSGRDFRSFFSWQQNYQQCQISWLYWWSLLEFLGHCSLVMSSFPLFSELHLISTQTLSILLLVCNNFILLLLLLYIYNVLLSFRCYNVEITLR